MNKDVLLALGAGSLAAVLVSWGIVSVLDQEVSYPLMIAVLALLLVSVVTREIMTFHHPLTPAGVVALTGLLLFVLRPLTIWANRVTSPGALADSRYFSSALVEAGSAALVQCLVFFCLFFIVYYAIALNQRATVIEAASLSALTRRESRVVSTTALQYLTLVASGGAFAAILYLIVSSGGPSAYVAGLALRSDFLSGRSFFALTYVPVQIALVLNVLHRRKVGVRVWNWVNVVAVVSLLVCGISAGGRGPLVIGVVLPLVLLKQFGPKPLRLRTLTTIGVGMLVVALTYSIVVRTSSFDGGRSLAQFKVDPVGVMLTQLTSGSETRPFDSLVRLNEAATTDGFEFQGGATYAAAPAWFVPRALWEGKPNGGGNTWFTSTYVPRFYGTARIETSLSTVGEGYANFGYAGVAGAGIVLGAVASQLRPRRRQDETTAGGLLGTTLTVVLTPLLFSLIRGDLYQGGSLTIATVGLTMAGYYVVSSRKPATAHGTVERRVATSVLRA